MQSTNTTQFAADRFAVAPMLGWTNRHCRAFHRLLTRESLLYTEMVTTGAILHGKGDYLAFDADIEDPVALQLGGSEPKDLALCAQQAEQYGYSEINLNVGCPSDRVQNGRFGACLMAEAERVAQCVAAMQQSVSIPVTVKTRLGIDDCDDYDFLKGFIQTVAQQGGCQTFTLHARKAWLKGLSPKENRSVPPLDYQRVYDIKKEFPQLRILINGGIETLQQCQQHLQQLDGVMLGRAAYANPWLLSEVDVLLFGAERQFADPIALVEAWFPYVEQQLQRDVFLGRLIAPLMGLFSGQRGGKQFRRYLSENAYKSGAGLRVLQQALEYVR